MQNKISKILKYINENYDIVATIQPRFLYKYNVYLKTEKYDLNIGIDIVDEDNFLYGKNDYLLSFDFEANKKYKVELRYHGGGYMTAYSDNDYTEIDKFLKPYTKKKGFKQTTIFDFL